MRVNPVTHFWIPVSAILAADIHGPNTDHCAAIPSPSCPC